MAPRITSGWVTSPWGALHVELDPETLRWFDPSGEEVPRGRPVFASAADALHGRHHAENAPKAYRKTGYTHAELTHPEDD